jgi:hypothetical protein
MPHYVIYNIYNFKKKQKIIMKVRSKNLIFIIFYFQQFYCIVELKSLCRKHRCT